MPHKYFYVDGVATYLHHTGATTLPESPPDLSRGEVVLCLHGTGRDGGDFAGLLAALGGDHSPLAFDQPAHGRSGGLDSLGAIDRMRDFTRGLVGKLGLREHVLVGHSLGAAVALDCALHSASGRGGDVRGVVVLSGGADFAFSDAFLERSRLVTEGKRRREFDPKAFSQGTAPDVMRRAFMAGVRTDPRATHGDYLALADWRPGDALAGIEVPVLVLHGDAEREEVVASAERLAGLLPNARKVVVPGAGEMLLYEQPDAVARAIRDFLGGLA